MFVLTSLSIDARPARAARHALFGRRARSAGRYVLVMLWLLVFAGAAAAQEATAPAFTVSTSHVFNTKESPAIALTHRQIDHLDFRVYRVNDAFAFFEKLRDPHQLGSEEPIVPQERTLLERIAIWKAARRSDIRDFLRGQVTREYRTARHERRDKEEVVLRRALNVNTFAQVPLLNPSQLVTSWREVLPPVREAEYRHVPLDLSAPGVYLVEAVNAPLRAYTVVVVSDVGLVTKTAPGELLVFAANRFSGEPMGNCQVRVLADQKTVGSGVTGADGTFKTALTVANPDALVTLATCNGQTAATDPGAYTVHSPTRDLVGYTYTDRPVYRPGHTVHYKSVLRWREQGDLAPFPVNTSVEVSVADTDDKVLLRERKVVDAFGALTGSFTIPATASLGYYTVRVTSGDSTATGSFEVQEYRKPEFDVAVRPATRLEVQGRRLRATIAARYYFGQPVAGAAVTYAVYKQGYYSPLRYESGGDEGSEGGDYAGGEQIFEGRARLNAEGLADIAVVLPVDDDGRDFTARIEARVIDASSREVAGASSVTATYGRFMLIARPDRYLHPANEAFAVNVRALNYDGAAQGAIRVHTVIERVEYRGYNNPPVITTLQQGDVDTDESGRAQWSATAPSQPGSYRLRVTAVSDGRTVSDTAYIWVPGASEVNDGDQFLELIADRRTYAPGDTAALIAQGVQFDASVLVTKESQHVSYHQVVKVRGGEAIQVPITGEDVGDTYVSIAFLKDDRLYRAERRLAVPATERRLTITAEADRTVVRPGEPGTFAIRVVDAKGAPVQRATERRARRRSALRCPSRSHAGSAAILLPSRIQPRQHVVLARVTRSSATPAPSNCC